MSLKVPQEINGDYSLTHNKAPFTYQWTETEEFIITKCRQRIMEKKSEEQLTPRERLTRIQFSNGPLDRLSINCSGVHNAMPRVFDAFAETPSVFGQRDMINYPNLDFLGQVIWTTKFWLNDQVAPNNFSYAEEVLSSKFRMIEYGPPLSIEPLLKTKEDALFFLDNMPDPALQGTYPSYLWLLKQSFKFFPEFVINGSVCPGTISGASFLRGIKNLLLDMRKNPEMAELILKCSSTFLHKKIDRMTNVLDQDLDESGKGNWLWWCDAASFFNLEEFKRTLPLTYSLDVPYAAKKGFRCGFAPEAPLTTMEVVCQIASENGGCIGILGHQESPPIEEWYKMTRKFDNVVAMCGADVKTMLDGPKERILEMWKRQAKIFAQYATQGYRTRHALGFDPTTPLENMEYTAKAYLETFKLPFQE
jgi:hypothetical protein